MHTEPNLRIAIGSWQGRVSPVFDVTRQAELIELHANQVGPRTLLPLPDDPSAKVDALAVAEVSALICGAVSRQVQEMLAQRGIQTIAFIAGEVDEVLAAWMDSRLGEPAFAMPGCCGGRRRRERGGCTDGVCHCPQCGHHVAHVPGQPCREQLCPACHIPMIRA